MKKFFIVFALVAFVLNPFAAKAKKSDGKKTGNSAASQTVEQQLERFASKLKSGSSATFVYSGKICNDDWKKICRTLKNAPSDLKISLDFSNAKYSEKYGRCYIPSECFHSIYNLVEIRLPEDLTEVYRDNFKDCPNLRAIYFPKNTTITKLEYNVLSDLNSLEEVHLYNFSGRLTGSVLDDLYNNDYKPVLKVLEMPEYPIFMDKSRRDFDERSFGLLKTVIMGDKTVSFDEWFNMCKAIEVKKVPFKSATASSCAAEKYGADKLFDNSWTSWVEGKSDEGIGETIEFTLSEPTSIDYFSIRNGFGNLDYYYANNRVKEMEMIFDDLPETKRTVVLEDTPFFQILKIEDFKRPYSKIKFTIKSVYKGTGPDNDTCLSEVKLNGYYASDFELDSGWKKVSDSLKGFSKNGYEYDVFPVENGNHFMSLFKNNGSYREFMGLFVRENGVWKKFYGDISGFEETSMPESAKPVVAMLEKFKEHGIPFHVTGWSPTFRIEPITPLSWSIFGFDFVCTKDGFTDYKRTPFTALCLEDAEVLKQYGDWRKNLFSVSETIAPLFYAAIFNENPSMIHYLVEEGYSPDSVIGSVDRSDFDYIGATPFEASIIYKNPAAQKALEDCGATWRKEFLIKTMFDGDLDKFQNLSQHYSDLSFVLAYAEKAMRNWIENKLQVDKGFVVHMGKFLKVLRDKNIDIFQQVTDLQKFKTSLLKQALYRFQENPNFFKLVFLYDFKIEGNEVADFIKEYTYHSDRKEIMDILVKLDEKSPLKDLSKEQKDAIIESIIYYHDSVDEIKFFIDRNVIDLGPQYVESIKAENTILCYVVGIAPSDCDEVVKLFVEAGADPKYEYTDRNGESNTVIGLLIDKTIHTTLDSLEEYDRYSKTFEYLYDKGARPKLDEIKKLSISCFYNLYHRYSCFDFYYKCIFKKILKEFTGPVFDGNKTLAEIILDPSKYPHKYYDEDEIKIAENRFKMIISDLKAENAAGDWNRDLFKKAGFSDKSIERIGL